jgi:ubiquinone/menaquinone biosynthesis C-methylase UbiE
VASGTPATPAFETSAPDQVTYLDRLAATGYGRGYKRRMLDELAPRPGQTVLDLGCGPGTDLAALAEAVTATGRVIGVDHDPAMADVARQRHAAAGHPGVEILVGDLHELPLPDRSADRARTDRVVQHLADPARALAEIRRVLRPGGRLVMGEPDWGSLAVDHPDEDLTRSYTRFVTDEVVRNARIGLRLPRLAAEAGFSVPTVVPVTPLFRDAEAADKILGLHRTTQRALAAGYFTPDEAHRWLDHLARGPFLAAATLHIVVAEA